MRKLRGCFCQRAARVQPKEGTTSIPWYRQKFLFVVLVANFCNNPRYMCSPRHPPALSFSGACMHTRLFGFSLVYLQPHIYSAMKRSHCSLHYKSIVEKSSLFTVSGCILPIPIIRLQISKCSSSQRPGILLALPGLKTELAYYTTKNSNPD